jgi:hypothetical protein
LASLLAIALNVSPATKAEATTDCETARGAVQKFFASFEEGSYEYVTGMKAANELCVGGCATMIGLYNWYSFGFAPANLRQMVLDSWNTCLLVGDNSGWDQPPITKYKTNRAPKILGTPKVGKTLGVAWGSWSGDSSWYEQAWFACKSASSKATSWIAENAVSINLPKSDCNEQKTTQGTIRLYPKHKGKFVIICQYSRNDYYHGVTCSPSVRVS